MDPNIYEKFRALIYDTSGITLGANKVALLTARIGKRMRYLDVNDHLEYFNMVVADKSGGELGELLNAISTNVTHFFREERHFEFFGKLIKEESEKGAQSFRIWCAASSTGEEPYSIAMTAMENVTKRARIEIIASDISTKVLQVAKTGIYKDQDVQGITPAIMKKYFQRGVGRADSFYRIKNPLRSLITFKQINLSTPPFPIEGILDVVFCRNVMIYFNDQLRKNLVENFRSLLKPQGYLIVGLAESLSGKSAGFRNIEPSVYRKD